MSIQKRWILSNAAIVVLPVLITLAAVLVFVFVSSRVFHMDIGYEHVRKLARIEYELIGTEGSILREKPERLMEKEFQQDLAARLAAVHGEVILLKNHTVVFATREWNKIDIEKCLQEAGHGFSNRAFQIGATSYRVNAFSVPYPDASTGWVILLAPLGGSDFTAARLLVFAASVFILSFLVVNVLLTYMLAKGILQPLKRLRAAAGEISHGNLDQAVVEEGEGEIRELCRSFEQMRIKLNAAVHTQMKYDDNRKLLVSSISHDLKTPITSIKGYVEGILDGVANTPEKVEKYLNTIYAKAVQVDGMIDDLLLYSKLDLNQLPFHFEATDVVRYFEDSVRENEAELEKAGVRLGLRSELKEARYVLLDRERMRRVVMNVIDNAAKYMDKPEGKIDILLRETTGSIVIEIADNGAGMTKEDIPRIFDRFYRADAARSRTGGSGLGLAIARQIVEGHGGRIWAVSHEKEGTSILISLKKHSISTGGISHEAGTDCRG